MASLPSYQDAISRLDWLELVAPVVNCRDYGSLCVVNRRFSDLFLPRLWNDPLRLVRMLGLDPGDDLEWYFDFIHVHMKRVRPSTLALVYSLDFRNFGKDTYHFSSDNDQRSLPQSFKLLPKLFPNLRCILLDGHHEVDPTFLVGGDAPPPPDPASAGAPQRPHVLSMAHCQRELTVKFFAASYLKDVVYLDVTGLSGSLRPLIAAASLPQGLPSLRILKARRREVDDQTAALLFKSFLGRLWSLDLSDNNLTDAIIETLRNSCFNSLSLRSEASFRSEGKLVFPDERGNGTYGPFKFIEESEWSGTFTHPERYFVDAPMYSVDGRGIQEDQAIRADGRSPIKLDSVDLVKRAIAGGGGSMAPTKDIALQLDVCMSPIGITHLHLSNNSLTSSGIERLLRMSPGQIEFFSCESMVFQQTQGEWWSSAWPKSTKLLGILGAAHVFRPLFSSNLRILRIHHSLVTQIPTLEVEGLSTMARLWVAETSIRHRSEMAFPQAFVPDMNPRLTSLTLTCIPRRTVGPLVEKLVGFLKLAAIQERAIQDVTMPYSWRNPTMLRGLRHVRLEFEPDPMDDPAGVSTSDDLDAEELLSANSDSFSFFSDESPTRERRRSSATKQKVDRAMTGAAQDAGNPSDDKSGRLQHFPYAQSKSEFFTYSGKWNGQFFTMPVWIGPGVVGKHAAVNEYMMLLKDPMLRSNVGPAMPAHVLAGAPERQCLFYSAWDAMVLPREMNVPTTSDLAKMSDAVAAIRKFRAETQAAYQSLQQEMNGGKVKLGEPHLFWTGRLDIVAKASTAHYQSSEYWR